MKKTTSTILFVLVMMISVLITSCTTVRSAALGVGTSAGLAIGSDDVQPSVDVGITYTETFQRQRINGTLGPLRMSMNNTSYAIMSKTISEDSFTGWAFDIKLKNPKAKLSIGVGPYIHVFSSFSPAFRLGVDIFGIGAATTARFKLSENMGMGVAGFIAVGIMPSTEMDTIKIAPAIRGGVYVTLLIHKEEFEANTV